MNIQKTLNELWPTNSKWALVFADTYKATGEPYVIIYKTELDKRWDVNCYDTPEKCVICSDQNLEVAIVAAKTAWRELQ